MKIKHLLITSTNTPGNKSLTLEEISDINSNNIDSDPMPYHYVIDIDGKYMKSRKDNDPVPPHRQTLVIAYVGGLDPETNEPCDTMTPQQKTALNILINNLKSRHNNITIVDSTIH